MLKWILPLCLSLLTQTVLASEFFCTREGTSKPMYQVEVNSMKKIVVTTGGTSEPLDVIYKKTDGGYQLTQKTNSDAPVYFYKLNSKLYSLFYHGEQIEMTRCSSSTEATQKNPVKTKATKNQR